MAEVLLAPSYFLRHDPKEWRTGKPYPPLGTLYAAAALRQKGWEVGLFDSMLASGEQEFVDRVAAQKPRLVVLYEDSFNWLSKMCLSRMRDAALVMARAARDSGARVIASGSDVTDHRDLYAEAGVEFVMVGEGERTVCEAADALLGDGGDIRSVPGISWREGTEVREAKPRRVETDLDVFPRPAWDLVDMEAYRRHWRERHGYFSLNLVTSRGCPYRCNWCAKPMFSRRYNCHSPGRVVDDLIHLRNQYAPDHIWFADDIFGLGRDWLPRFEQLVQEREIRIPYKCLSRADLLDQAAVDALADSGCQELWLGAESGSQAVLDAMEKDVTVEQILAATERLQRRGIRVGFFLQFGYLGEEMDDIRRTFDLVRRSVPDEIGISVSYPLPGTPFHEKVRARMGDKTNWVDSADFDTLYETPYGRPFYRALHGVVHRHHRLYRGLRAARSLVRGAGLDRRTLARVVSVPLNAMLLVAGRMRLHGLAARGVG